MRFNDGGITKDCIQALQGLSPESFKNETQFENIEYRNMISFYNKEHPQDLVDYNNYLQKLQSIGLNGIAERNGLTEEENLRLTNTQHISEAIFLILKGLLNIFSND